MTAPKIDHFPARPRIAVEISDVRRKCHQAEKTIRQMWHRGEETLQRLAGEIDDALANLVEELSQDRFFDYVVHRGDALLLFAGLCLRRAEPGRNVMNTAIEILPPTDLLLVFAMRQVNVARTELTGAWQIPGQLDAATRAIDAAAKVLAFVTGPPSTE